MKRFTYSGTDAVGSVVRARLETKGYVFTTDVAMADVVLTYCTSQTALEDAYFDEQGIVHSAKPNTLLIDLSAATPSFARELNAVATVSDLACIEAPLVVSQVSDEAFTSPDGLRCFVAGEDDDIEAARPVLEAVVAAVVVTGGSGSAQLARAAYTLQISAQVMSAIEADALYRATQRSANAFGAAFGGAGALTPEAQHILDAIEAGNFEGTYTVEMFMSELSAALMAADDVDLILPQAEACLHLLELLAVIGGADKSPASLALVYGEEAACAENGLDWTRAEQAYTQEGDEFGEYDDEDDYSAGFGAYSAN